VAEAVPRVAWTGDPPSKVRVMSVTVRLRGPVWGWRRVTWSAVTGWTSFTWRDSSVPGLNAPSVHAVSGLPSTALSGWFSAVLVIGLEYAVARTDATPSTTATVWVPLPASGKTGSDASAGSKTSGLSLACST
jgi:hypothetical protein